MPIENWSDTIVLAELQNDPGLTDDLTSLTDQVERSKQIDVVLDLANVNFLNSSNIAKLLRLRKMLLSNDRNLRLCGVNTHVWGIFLITGLDKVFTFCDDVSQGLASVQIDRV